jgi:hypothetical protein
MRLLALLLLISSVAFAQKDATFRAYRSTFGSETPDSTAMMTKPVGSAFYNIQGNKWYLKDATGWFNPRSITSNRSDPGAHRLWGWDNTDNDIKWITIGSGLSYDHATYTLSASGGGITGTLTSGRVPYATGASTVTDEAGFEYNAGTNFLAVGNINVGATVGSIICGSIESGFVIIGNEIRANSGNRYFGFTDVGNTNSFNIANATGGNGPTLSAIGSDTNIDINYATKGTGDHIFTLNGSEKLRVTDDGRLYGTALHDNAGAVTGATNQYVASGTYTPTLAATNTFNVTGTTSGVCQWMRVGNVVTVSGAISIDPTTNSVATQLSVSLPIASNFTATRQVGGTGSTAELGTANPAATISGDGTNDTALFNFTVTDNANHAWHFSFTYLIL